MLLICWDGRDRNRLGLDREMVVPGEVFFFCNVHMSIPFRFVSSFLHLSFVMLLIGKSSSSHLHQGIPSLRIGTGIV